MFLNLKKWSVRSGDSKTTHVSKSIQRRSTLLTCLALDVAFELSHWSFPKYAVFASRHGEISRVLELLLAISQQEPLSPTCFSQSVHNTASGIYAITNKSNMAINSIAAGPTTLNMALLDAYAYLTLNKEHSVLVIYFEQSLPPEFQKDIEEPSTNISLGFLLTYPKENFKTVSLQPKSLEQNVMDSLIPQIVDLSEGQTVDISRWVRAVK